MLKPYLVDIAHSTKIHYFDKTYMRYFMEIFDIFHFQNGWVIFAGKLPEKIPRITGKIKYVVNLIVDGKTYQENIQITGEMLGGRHPDGYRGITTTEEVKINSEFVKNHHCQLILTEVMPTQIEM